MSTRRLLPFEKTLDVRETCLCLGAQQAARALARHFDKALRPLGLTSGQFSLLMSLNRPQPPAMGEVAALLAMDRTTLTAALKLLERRGLVVIAIDRADRRSRRVTLTRAGRTLLADAYPLWLTAHVSIERKLAPSEPRRLRKGLTRIVQRLSFAAPARPDSRSPRRH